MQTHDITFEQAEQAKETLLDFFAFERVYKHSLQGLSRSTIIDKYIKTYTRGVTA